MLSFKDEALDVKNFEETLKETLEAREGKLTEELFKQMQEDDPTLVAIGSLAANAKHGAKIFKLSKKIDHDERKGITKRALDNSVQRPPRHFPNRIERELRWVSTFFLAYAAFKGKKATEVQAAIFNGQLIIAVNENETNEWIVDKLKDKSLSDLLKEVNASKRPFGDGTERVARHVASLSNKVGALKDYLNQKLETVPLDTPENKKQRKGLHAERRIAEYVTKANNDNDIKNWVKYVEGRVIVGTRRPCTSCALDLGLLNSGPLWTSGAANRLIIDVAELARLMEPTAVTVTRSGTITNDFGSESENSDDTGLEEIIDDEDGDDEIMKESEARRPRTVLRSPSPRVKKKVKTEDDTRSEEIIDDEDSDDEIMEESEAGRPRPILRSPSSRAKKKVKTKAHRRRSSRLKKR